ncbi:MAG: MBL fold metallo-hydrolase, partial [Solirubrobacterales bacterium]|nr:MBL fold metallo-hydrolase [Solirubrobacterales bacterium]
QTSFYVEGGEEPLLIDCGATTLAALKRLGIDSTSIGVVVLSHLHGDHFGGLPWLVLDGQFGERTRPLTIAGPERTQERFNQAFEVLYPGAQEGGWAFDIRVVEMASRRPTELGPARVTTFPVIHTPATFPHGLRIEYGGKVIAYSGDTEWTDALFELAEGADLFVCECQSYDREIPGHLNFRTLSAKRSELGCRRLVINHLGESMLARVGELDIEAAEDGLEIEV